MRASGTSFSSSPSSVLAATVLPPETAQVHDDRAARPGQLAHRGLPGIVVTEELVDAVAPIGVGAAIERREPRLQVGAVRDKGPAQPARPELRQLVRLDQRGRQIDTADHVDRAAMAPELPYLVDESARAPRIAEYPQEEQRRRRSSARCRCHARQGGAQHDFVGHVAQQKSGRGETRGAKLEQQLQERDEQPPAVEHEHLVAHALGLVAALQPASGEQHRAEDKRRQEIVEGCEEKLAPRRKRQAAERLKAEEQAGRDREAEKQCDETHRAPRTIAEERDDQRGQSHHGRPIHEEFPEARFVAQAEHLGPGVSHQQNEEVTDDKRVALRSRRGGRKHHAQHDRPRKGEPDQQDAEGPEVDIVQHEPQRGGHDRMHESGERIRPAQPAHRAAARRHRWRDRKLVAAGADLQRRNGGCRSGRRQVRRQPLAGGSAHRACDRPAVEPQRHRRGRHGYEDRDQHDDQRSAIPLDIQTFRRKRHGTLLASWSYGSPDTGCPPCGLDARWCCQ